MNPFAEESTALTKVWICSYLPQRAQNVALVQKPANNILRGKLPECHWVGSPNACQSERKQRLKDVQRRVISISDGVGPPWIPLIPSGSSDRETRHVVISHLAWEISLKKIPPASSPWKQWNHGITHKLIQMTPRNLEPVQQSNTTSYLALPLQTMPQPERDFASTSKWLSQGIGKGWHRIRCSQIRWAICLDMGADKHPTCKSWNAFKKNGNVSLELIRVQSWAPLSQWLLELLISSHQIWIHMFEIPQHLWMDPNLSSRKCFQVSYVFDKNSSFKYTRYAPGQVWQVTLPLGNLA